jgi:hypothetical protein
MQSFLPIKHLASATCPVHMALGSRCPAAATGAALRHILCRIRNTSECQGLKPGSTLVRYPAALCQEHSYLINNWITHHLFSALAAAGAARLLERVRKNRFMQKVQPSRLLHPATAMFDMPRCMCACARDRPHVLRKAG